MGEPEREADDLRMAILLAKIDEAIAEGRVADDDQLAEALSSISPDDAPQLHRAADVLRLLDELRPRDISLANDTDQQSLASSVALGRAHPESSSEPTTLGYGASTPDLESAQVSGSKASEPLGDLPKSIARFQLRKRIGQGGFGVVFLAEDPILNRQVAIKIPRPEALFNDDLKERFLKEGKAAAALNHAGIVPVFESGRSGQIYYLVSAFCPGPNLAHWYEKNGHQLTALQAADWLRQIAEAMQHAHSRNILHRDLKPSNILLVQRAYSNRDSSTPTETDVHDTSEKEADANATSLQPLVADFGLAKRLDTSDESATKGILGTPHYMSPEQAAGDGNVLGPATDIYSLGALLFYMLAGRPPFQSNSTFELLRAVQSENPPRLSNFAPDTPRDLEAICLKCLEKEPAKRYLTATELAADLTRFLNHEPVHAQPIRTSDRLRKWCQRNPVVATLSAAIGVAIVAIGIVSMIGWNSTTTALRDEARARNDEALAKQAAEDRFEDAWQAVNESFVRISEDRRLKSPGMEQLRQDLLTSALTYYARFLEERAAAPNRQFEVAQAHLRVGQVQFELGDNKQAEDSFETGLDILSTINPRSVDSDIYFLEFGSGLDGIANIQRRRRDFSTAAKLYQDTDEIWQKAPERSRRKRVKTLISLAVSLQAIAKQPGKLEQALETIELAIKLAAEQLAETPDDLNAVDDHCSARGQASLILRHFNRIDESVRLQQAVHTELQTLIEEQGLRDADLLATYARACGNLGKAMWMRRDRDAAESYARQCVATGELLELIAPNRFEYQLLVAQGRNQLGSVLGSRQQLTEASNCYEEAISQLEELRLAHPTAHNVNLELGLTHGNYAIALASADDREASREHLTSARDVILEQLQYSPNDPQLLLFVCNIHQNLATSYLEDDQLTLAAETYLKSIELLTEQMAFSDSPLVREQLALAYLAQATTFGRLAEFEKAIASAESAIEFARPEDLPYYRLARLLCFARSGDVQTAESELTNLTSQLVSARDHFLFAQLHAIFAGNKLGQERSSERDQCLTVALTHLQLAAQKGYFDKPSNCRSFAENAEWELVRDDSRFAALQIPMTDSLPQSDR